MSIRTAHAGLTPQRETEIRNARYSSRSLAAADIDVDDLLAELDRLRVESAETTVEYGISGLPFGRVADATTNDFYAKARLASYQQSWPAAHLVTRTVRHSTWTPVQDGGQS